MANTVDKVNDIVFSWLKKKTEIADNTSSCPKAYTLAAGKEMQY
jgi:hypothetical protein